MNNKITVINQMVDTLKLHLYISDKLSDKNINDYNTFVSNRIDDKTLAMNIKSRNREDRFTQILIKQHSFKVMATATTGFNVALENGDVTISLRKITDKTSNTPILKIEFRADYLARFGYVKAIKQVKKTINTFLPQYNIKVSELHLATDVQGYEFSMFDLYKIQTKAKNRKAFNDNEKSVYLSNSKLTGFVFGSGNFMLRIYDKTFEINKFKKKGFITDTRWIPNGHYDDTKNVFRVEIQYRRAYFKTLYGDNGKLDGFEAVLNSIPELWNYAITRYQHKDLTQQQCIDHINGFTVTKKGIIKLLTKDTIRKRLSRAPLTPFWEAISLWKNFKAKNLTKVEDVKKPEVEYVKNSIKSVFTTLTKLTRGYFDSSILTDILVQANQENINKKGYSILEGALLKTVDHFQSARVQFIKNGVVSYANEEYERDLKHNFRQNLEMFDNQGLSSNILFELEKKGFEIYAS